MGQGAQPQQLPLPSVSAPGLGLSAKSLGEQWFEE